MDDEEIPTPLIGDHSRTFMDHWTKVVRGNKAMAEAYRDDVHQDKLRGMKVGSTQFEDDPNSRASGELVM